MPKYNVTIPMTGLIAMDDIEADSEEDAIEKAMMSVSLDELIEWEVHEKIVQGNVFYGVENEIEVEESEGFE